MVSAYIDSAARFDKKVELKENGAVVGEKSGDIDVVVALRELLMEGGLTVGDIADIAFNPGPGSFTGLKMGSVISNVLGWGLGKLGLKDLRYPDYGGEPNIQPPKGI